MSKIIFAQFLFILLLFPYTGSAIDIVEVSVGDQSSGSWIFTDRLSRLWRKKYPEERSKFDPKHVANVHERFEDIQKGNSAFAVAPLKSIGDFQMKEMRIKVVLILWKTFLVAFNVGEEEPLESPASYEEWFVPKNSVIIPTVFRNSAGLYNQPMIIETEIDGLEKIYGRKGVLFFEALGSLNDLRKAMGKELDILKIDKRLINILLKRHSWLEPFELANPQMNTVALTMALFAHESRREELVKKTLATLLNPPRSVFPRSYIMKNLSLDETAGVSYRLLHPETLKYFKGRLR